MNITVIDFETYFDNCFSLPRLTTPEYIHDPRFHVHGLVIHWPEGAINFFTDVAEALRQLRGRFGEHLERTTLVCHNAYFDLYILNHLYHVRPRFFIDTRLLAYHVLGRRDRAEGVEADLASLSARYGLQSKGNLEFMCGVRDPDPKQLSNLSDYARRDAEITAALVGILLPQIARPEVELQVLMHSVRLFTERRVRVDVAGIEPVKRAVREQTAQFLREASVTNEAVSSNTQFTSLLETALARTGRCVPLKAGKNGLIPAIAKTDAEMQALLDDDDPAVAALARARLEKKGEDQKLARLDTLRRIANAAGGLPPYLVYHGAHTGRFAGGDGFNLQNLSRDGLGGQVRGLLLPEEGCVFVIADFAQIEARVTAWYAGEHDMLDGFGEGCDLYSEFAARTFGREVRKPNQADAPDVRVTLAALREVGKRAVLGLGFGMGALTFLNRLRAAPNLASLFDSGALSPLVCKQLVDEFRSRYPAIPRFWVDLEAAARSSVDGTSAEVGSLQFMREENEVRLWLPSGRALRYPELRLESQARTIRYLDGTGNEAEFTPNKPALVYGRDTTLYGGKLCENVAQATARDLLIEAVLRLEKRGLPVAFHVHDEVVVQVSQVDAEAAKRAVEQELSATPAWAEGLPVACEVRIAGRYGK